MNYIYCLTEVKDGLECRKEIGHLKSNLHLSIDVLPSVVESLFENFKGAWIIKTEDFESEWKELLKSIKGKGYLVDKKHFEGFEIKTNHTSNNHTSHIITNHISKHDYWKDKKRDEDTKIKISESVKKSWETRKRTQSKESNLKRSESLKNYWSSRKPELEKT